MLLCLGKPLQRRTRVEQGVEDLASDVALQAPDDVALGHALSGAASDVRLGAFIAGQADYDDASQRVAREAVGATSAVRRQSSRSSSSSSAVRPWCRIASLNGDGGRVQALLTGCRNLSGSPSERTAAIAAGFNRGHGHGEVPG